MGRDRTGQNRLVSSLTGIYVRHTKTKFSTQLYPIFPLFTADNFSVDDAMPSLGCISLISKKERKKEEMGERKVQNKYYPPDFDPAIIPKSHRNRQIKVTTMLPMSIRCSTCGNYMYKGTKFNVRKEDVIGETYRGMKIFRFYYKCTRCSAEITIKTDPQNSDYVVESGAARNFEPWRAEDEVADEKQRKRVAEEMGDAMKSLENRTRDSKREMDILSAIDETKSIKARHATVSQDALLKALQPSAPVQGCALDDIQWI
ncbi:hypothetical protein OSB04_005857 [Centaurea solstitialis]|uniref:Splicing factor YJU2 n=1 Tax=Centaurea solstitialis TaxID=347529 RepID=A0AA38TZZ4_9ASTR|nr:hypothetical protein OSB04_005857 [Centaurea solstitialis]